MHFSKTGALLGLLVLAAACGAEEPAPETDLPEVSTGALEPVEWTYSGATGPEAWGSLSPEFAACQTGTTQSPIDLVGATAADLPDLDFNYQPTPLEVVNKVHTVQANYGAGSTLAVGDTTYQLVQFHFHTPSEHRLDGEEFPMELHLVHQGPAGGLAVVGVMVRNGSELGAAPVWDHLPANRGEEIREAALSVNAADLLPAGRGYYRYPGSLTTPPCTEGVKWFVLAEPIQMSNAQIEAVRSIITTSNRPVQPLGSRTLLLDS